MLRKQSLYMENAFNSLNLPDMREWQQCTGVGAVTSCCQDHETVLGCYPDKRSKFNAWIFTKHALLHHHKS